MTLFLCFFGVAGLSVLGHAWLLHCLRPKLRLRVLRLLDEGGPARTRRLAERIKQDPQDLAGYGDFIEYELHFFMRELERGGFVESQPEWVPQPHPRSDYPRRIYSITDEGLALLQLAPEDF